MKDLYVLLVDSYNELFLFDNKLFRTYNLALPYDSIANFIPQYSSIACAPITARFEWLRKGLEKTQYVQQFDTYNNLEFEIKMPAEVNCFVGYNDKKQEYYFRKKPIGFDQRLYNKTVVYIYKIR